MLGTCRRLPQLVKLLRTRRAGLPKPSTADLGDSTNVAAVGEELARSGHKIDALILNARAVSGNGMVPTDDGIELMMAS